jgi:hypothetical protein
MRVAILAMVLAASAGGAQDRPPDRPSEASRRTIAVSGQGEVKAVPDRIVISFAVESTGPRAGEAAAQNARVSSAVSAAVKKLLGPTDTVTTTRYSIEPRYESAKPGEAREPRISGYVARNEVQVESQSIDKADDLIDAATKAGANRVGGLQFALSNRADLQRAAIEKAGGDARAQAESAAKGLGVRLKQVVSATTATQPIIVPRQFQAMAVGEARAASTPIEPGEATVSASLQVVYEIE